MSRSSEEREAARRERERRRAEREGRPLPPEPEAAPAVPVWEAPPEPVAETPRVEEPDPHATQQWDAVSAEADADAHADPQATRQWDVASELAAEHPEPEPAPAPAPAEAPPTEQFDVAAGWTGERAAVATAAPADPATEVPLGTRRVAPHEHPRLAARMSGGGAGGRGRGRGSKRAASSAAGGGAPGRPAGLPRPRRRIVRRIFALIALALIAVVGWFLISLYQPFTGDGGGKVVVQVPHGATVSEIGDLLASKGVISSPFFFHLRASLSGAGADLKSGTFTLREGMSYMAALDALGKNPAPPPVLRVTIPEGRSRAETAPIAKQAGLSGDYLKASRSSKLLDPHKLGAPKGASLEGFLFPATYELKRKATVQDLVAAQLTAFQQNLATVDLRYAKSKNLTVYDVLVIASMVEREVAVAKERPLVAAVIYNRLRQGIPLGIDATLRFALNDWTHPLRVSELQNPTPYNTRLHQGLPPGPIGNPGLASIKAAAHPAKVGYLYYVVKPGTCGEHAFSSTDAQFQRDVAKYNQARNAAGGKSPTKC